jgi:hypothetical protein
MSAGKAKPPIEPAATQETVQMNPLAPKLSLASSFRRAASAFSRRSWAQRTRSEGRATEAVARRAHLAGAREVRRAALGSLAAASGLFLLAAAPAQASSSPWWHLTAISTPTTLAPGGHGLLTFDAINVGNDSTQGPITVRATMPAGVTVEQVEINPGEPEPLVGFWAYAQTPGFGPASAGPFKGEGLGPEEENAGLRACREPAPREVECTYAEFFEPVAPFQFLELRVALAAEAAPAGPGGPVQLEVTGGGAPGATASQPLAVGATPPPFGVNRISVVPEEEGGATDTQAGSHPYQLTTTFALNQNTDPLSPPALPRDLQFRLPTGLVGSAVSSPRCSEGDFSTIRRGIVDICPPETAIGSVTVFIDEPVFGGTQTITLPVFNLVPAFGEPARFGFEYVGAPVVIDTHIRNGEDYGVTASVSNITQVANFLSESLTLWGTPGDASHDQSRGWPCVAGQHWAQQAGFSCAPSSGVATPAAFLTLPTSCGAPFATTVTGDSWPRRAAPGAEPESVPLPPGTYSLADGLGQTLPVSGCNRLAFNPKVTAVPTATAAAAPTGLSFDLDFGNEGIDSPHGTSESEVKKAVVTLPEGVTTNPSVANGLSACSEAQYEEENLADEAGCPESSKIGEVEIESPLVAQTIEGSIYVARQGENPNHNLVTIYMVAKNAELGVLVRSAGKVVPDERTGQLTTTFDELPQLPFTHFHLSFRQGQRAPLITPGLCGTYATQAQLYPYSNPEIVTPREATFQISSGAGGGACASSASQLPNKPSLEAGTTSPLAGAYSPFVFRVKRDDGSQVLSTISATLPKGLLGKLAGIKECTNAEIAQAEGRSGEGQGALELSSPSCPASSEVGVVTVGTGVGSQPYYVQGKAYLAGPYKGAPVSLAIITPAVVGPFDLGTIVVRTALYVDETTAQIHAVSDAIPTIVHGLPTVVQSISLNTNRPNFTLNPTSCDGMQILGSVTSTLGNVAPLTDRFQVGACNALAFKPTLKLSFSGQTKRTGHPGVKAVLTQPKGLNANIARASVVLPKGMLIAQAHVNSPCTRVQFNSTAVPGEACPPKSVLGHAKVWTPLLEAPEEGPVYFRSNGGERELPDLVVALRGRIPVQLVGFIDSTGKKGAEVRRVRTRFQSVPDAPISRFELKLSGGKKGLLENSQNLCRAKKLSKLQLTGQNGKTYDTEPVVAVAGCSKKAKSPRAPA